MKLRPPVRSRRKNRRTRQFVWKYFPLLSLGVLSLGASASFLGFEGFSSSTDPSRSFSLSLPGMKTSQAGLSGAPMMLSSVDDSTIRKSLQTAKDIETKALEQMEVLIAKGWHDASEQQWSQVEALWQSAAETLVDVAMYQPGLANRAEISSSEVLKTHYHDYQNRQDLTLAIRDYQKSIFWAEQLDPNDKTVCDVQTRLSDSPDKWEMVVSLRQQSLDYLRAVARNVSFYEDQVVPLQTAYEQGLETATRMQQRGPWYYAIQKAVCATEWSERAKASGDREDWLQSAAFWREGIELLEGAPDRIPVQIPNKYRERYQIAKDNLALWKENLKDAETRAVSR